MLPFTALWHAHAHTDQPDTLSSLKQLLLGSDHARAHAPLLLPASTWHISRPVVFMFSFLPFLTGTFQQLPASAIWEAGCISHASRKTGYIFDCAIAFQRTISRACFDIAPGLYKLPDTGYARQWGSSASCAVLLHIAEHVCLLPQSLKRTAVPSAPIEQPKVDQPQLAGTACKAGHTAARTQLWIPSGYLKI